MSKFRYGLFLIAFGCGMASIATTHLVLLDGIDGAVLSLVFVEDTVYAPGYTDRGFRSIKPGMSVEAVERILGKPLEQHPIPRLGGFGWRYARSARDSHYRIRSIQFDQRGTVVGRSSRFYVD